MLTQLPVAHVMYTLTNTRHLVYQRSQDQGGVNAAACDDHVCSMVKGSSNWKGPAHKRYERDGHTWCVRGFLGGIHSYRPTYIRTRVSPHQLPCHTIPQTGIQCMMHAILLGRLCHDRYMHWFPVVTHASTKTFAAILYKQHS